MSSFANHLWRQTSQPRIEGMAGVKPTGLDIGSQTFSGRLEGFVVASKRWIVERISRCCYDALLLPKTPKPFTIVANYKKPDFQAFYFPNSFLVLIFLGPCPRNGVAGEEFGGNGNSTLGCSFHSFDVAVCPVRSADFERIVSFG